MIAQFGDGIGSEPLEGYQMDVEEALAAVNALLTRGHLNHVQEIVFRQSWEGKSYQEIAQDFGYSAEYIKAVGYKLWKSLSEVFGEKITRKNFQYILRRHLPPLQAEPPDTEPNRENVQWKAPAPPVYPSPHHHELMETEELSLASHNINSESGIPKVRQDWGEAVDVSSFYGRAEELTTLKQWILQDTCRLVALFGMGGMGKTALAVKLAEQVQGEFEYLVWRSLRNAPPIQKLLTDLLQFLSDEQEINVPETIEGKILRLVDYFRSSRCLIVLDNLESVLGGSERIGRNRAGHYRESYEGYGQLLRCVGEIRHQSCLVFTSQEQPIGFTLRQAQTSPIRSLQLKGLPLAEGQKIFREKGHFTASTDEWQVLIAHYGGNPLALKIVATAVQDLFDSNISRFLELLPRGDLVFGDVYDLLDRQFKRLSDIEKQVMYWLAIEREWVSSWDLLQNIVIFGSKSSVIEALDSLRRRFLIEKKSAGFTQQPVVRDYITKNFVEQIFKEIITEKVRFLMSCAIVKSQAKNYIRENPNDIILKQITERLLTLYRNPHKIEEKLNRILVKIRENFANLPGYGAGNIINLFRQLKINLTDYDFSHLTVWQADLREMNLHRVNFTEANLAKSVFSTILGNFVSVAFSPDGKLLATSNFEGGIYLWQVVDSKHLFTYQGHTGWVWSIAFSPDSQTLASGSADQTVRLWDVSTHQCHQTLHEHTDTVRSVAFSLDGVTLASSSQDGTVKLWDVSTGQCLNTLRGHTNWVWSVAFSPNSQTLASSSTDQTVKLWDVSTGQCLNTFRGHTDWVWSVAFNPNGHTLASGSQDQTVKLWDVSTGQCLNTLRGHTNWVWSVAFNPNGHTLASGSQDQTVKLWDVSTGQCLNTLQGHPDCVWCVIFSPDGQTLASSSQDETIKLWDVNTGKCIKTLTDFMRG